MIQSGAAERCGINTFILVASIDETEMVCYGPVFSQEWAPDAFWGKYVFAHVDEETVNGWDEQHNIEAE